MQLGSGFQLSYFLLFFPLLHLCSSYSYAESSNETEEVTRSQFPDGFLFGTATSSYQIEGAYLEDGKGLNNWDVFSHIPGNIENNDNGDVADDHYHRFLEDIEIMRGLGVNSYRFSISWARILPKGRFGEVNPGGIKFYDYLIDNLLLRGIEPFVTIYHQDHPREIEDRYESWLSPQIQEDFVHFAKICFENFGDRVKYWVTLNEANLLTDMGYIKGWYPPARCSAPFGNCSVGNSDTEPLIVLHNMLLSHAKAVNLYRKHFQAKQGGCIGIVAHANMFEPLRDEELDRQAASRVLAFTSAWMLDPLVFGDYPSEMRQYLGHELPSFSPLEIEYIKGSVDFIGINHYSTLYAKDCIHSACILGYNHTIRGYAYTTGARDGVTIGEPTGNPTFFVVPEGLEKIIQYIQQRYNNMPIYVTENGYSPPRKQNQQVQDLLNDVKRIEYHKGYLAALATAIRTGADVRGYFIWSLIDNLEWIDGFSTTFGLYYVDRQTLNRIPKLSARWYKNFLTNNNTSHINHHREELNANSSNSKSFVVLRSENKRVEMY